MRRVILTLGVFIAVVATASMASAEKAKRGKGVVQLDDLVIIGKVQKPVAAVDVARMRPQAVRAETRQPFVDRIDDASLSEPF